MRVLTVRTSDGCTQPACTEDSSQHREGHCAHPAASWASASDAVGDLDRDREVRAATVGAGPAAAAAVGGPETSFILKTGAAAYHAGESGIAIVDTGLVRIGLPVLLLGLASLGLTPVGAAGPASVGILQYLWLG